MKVAIVEVPYSCRLAIPLERLGALEFSYLVNAGGYGSDEKFTVAKPSDRVEIKVVDTNEIVPHEQPDSSPADDEQTAIVARQRTQLDKLEAILHRVRNGETVEHNEIDIALELLPF